MEVLRHLSDSNEGRILVEILEQLVSECESAKGKKSWEEVQGGLIAGRILRSELIDKIESLSNNKETKLSDEKEYE